MCEDILVFEWFWESYVFLEFVHLQLFLVLCVRKSLLTPINGCLWESLCIHLTWTVLIEGLAFVDATLLCDLLLGNVLTLSNNQFLWLALGKHLKSALETITLKLRLINSLLVVHGVGHPLVFVWEIACHLVRHLIHLYINWPSETSYTFSILFWEALAISWHLDSLSIYLVEICLGEGFLDLMVLYNQVWMVQGLFIGILLLCVGRINPSLLHCGR